MLPETVFPEQMSVVPDDEQQIPLDGTDYGLDGSGEISSAVDGIASLSVGGFGMFSHVVGRLQDGMDTVRVGRDAVSPAQNGRDGHRAVVEGAVTVQNPVFETGWILDIWLPPWSIESWNLAGSSVFLRQLLATSSTDLEWFSDELNVQVMANYSLSFPGKIGLLQHHFCRSITEEIMPRTSLAETSLTVEPPMTRQQTTTHPGNEPPGVSSTDEATDGQGRTEPILAVEDLTKGYAAGTQEISAVDGISFEIESGSIVGLLGPNGAGKTTTIKSILGTIIPDSGRITFDGTEVTPSRRRLHGRVGAMFEGARNSYWRLSVRQNLDFFSRLDGTDPREQRDRHDELLHRFGLSDRADTQVRNLSRGMKQKLSLATTLSGAVDLVFLDEPTLGLDVETSYALREELQRLAGEDDITIVLSSQDMDTIQELCDRVLILSDGEIVVDDSVENLLDAFEKTEYRVRIEDPVPDGVESVLESAYTVSAIEEVPDGLDVQLRLDGDDVLDLCERLRDEDCRVTSLESVQPGLEDVFLQYTDAHS